MDESPIQSIEDNQHSFWRNLPVLEFLYRNVLWGWEICYRFGFTRLTEFSCHSRWIHLVLVHGEYEKWEDSQIMTLQSNMAQSLQ